MNFSVTKNGIPLSEDLYDWNEKTRTFSTSENDLVLDFSGSNNVTFKTSSKCTFTTGSNCTFTTGWGCTFKTGDKCTFTTDTNCTFKTSSDCTFNTGDNCTFKTSDDCTFNIHGENGKFDVGKSCIGILRPDNKNPTIIILKEGRNEL